MSCRASRVILILVASLLLTNRNATAGSDFAPLTVEAEAFQWAQGRIIDSIQVVGNDRTKSFALLREMESRAGSRLDAVAVARDQRFLHDLSSVADARIEVEPVGTDRCRLRVHVTERSTLLVKLVYPVLEYDFDSEQLKYGLKWDDRNFRRRLETFSANATRNSDGDSNASLGWSAPWIGWRHIGVGAQASYFNRANTPVRRAIVEQSRVSGGVSWPLTESRITFAQVLGNLSVQWNRLDSQVDPSQREVVLSPLVGLRYDGRDSHIRPSTGMFVFLSTQFNQVLSGGTKNYYQLLNDVRVFHTLNDVTVLGLYSNLVYQFGDYPDYTRYGLGGAGTLRGYSNGVFEGAHRWIQTAEFRMSPLPERVFHLPIAGVVDVSVSLVMFVDTGIAWKTINDFSTDNFRTGFGYGIRVYSPIQDVVRMDLGFNRHGGVHPYFSTGIRF